jgi:Glycosyltransferase family 87
MLAAMVLAIFTVFSAGSMTHGFVSYYTASRLLAGGELGPRAYDDQWFGDAVKRLTASDVREIFIPNPPTMAVMAMPLIGLEARAARAAWLIASLLVFIAGVAALVNYQALRNRDVSIPVLLLMLLSPAVFTNLRIGQGYLIVFALFTATALLLIRGRDRAAGICLGGLLALKTSGVAIVFLLIARRRWQALAAAGITAWILAIAITPFIDATMWTIYPSQVRAYVARPASAVTAYQTTLGLVRHLCVADAQWNPSPAANCAPVAFLIPYLIIGAATAVTIVLTMRSRRAEPWVAAGTTLSVLSLPAIAEPHFVLMAIPLALLRLKPIEIVLIGALLIVPLEWTAERYTAGWWSLLAYPRLYAAWLLWGAAIRELLAAKTAQPPPERNAPS